MKTTIYKVELMVVDPQNLPEQAVVWELENAKYVHSLVKKIESREVDWFDEHPLNFSDTSIAAFNELFSGSLEDAHAAYIQALDQSVDFD